MSTGFEFRKKREVVILSLIHILEAQNSPELKVVKAAWPELWAAYISLF